MKMGWLLLYSAVGCLMMLFSGLSADPDCTNALKESERAGNAVELKFYRILTDTWTSEDNSAKVAVHISDQANAYCESNPGACGLDNCCSSEFKDVSVGVVSGYPQLADNEKDLLLKLYVDFPSSLNASGSLQCVLGADTVREMIGNVRQGIFDDTGSWITYVDTVFYGIPPDNQLNAIIIPIAFVIVLAIVIAALILHFWNKRREDARRRQERVERRKTAKVAPTTYNMPGAPKQGEKPGEPKPEKPKRKDEIYKENLRRQTKIVQKTSSIHSEDSAIKLDNEPRQRKTYAYDQNNTDGATGYGRPVGTLQPLELADDTQVDSERKKKKKHKKHRKHREQEAFENQAFEDSTGAREY